MSAEPETNYATVAAEQHPHCVVCGQNDLFRLGLQFSPQADGSMHVAFAGGKQFQGYRNIMHGGVLAMVLDSAMTHCLFAHGMAGVTADLHIRYLQPVLADKELAVTCAITQRKLKLLTLRAAVRQEGTVKVRSEARFWQVSEI